MHPCKCHLLRPPHTETVSPLPSCMDLLVQGSPDSSTSPRVKVLPTSAEEITAKKDDPAQGKKQKIRTVFSQTQLHVLNDRFQRQKYLSLQQMQELSNILNLSYKQVKTWFQNQRMKCKRWQKNNWPKNNNTVILYLCLDILLFIMFILSIKGERQESHQRGFRSFGCFEQHAEICFWL
uniref:Homeobox domain-containing protein n=1 Tax=Felis catus TaxID=9685 RepID=A0ABI7Z314_FELCA